MKKSLNKVLAMFFMSGILVFSACKPTTSFNPSGNSSQTGGSSQSGGSSQGADEEELPAPTLKEKSVEKIENVEPTVIITEPYYKLKADGLSLDEGDTVCSSDFYNEKPILEVTSVGNGFVIRKYNDPKWLYTSIKVKNVTKNINTAFISVPENESKSGSENYYFYPFAQAGEEYDFWVEKQEANYSNWGESKKVRATALGGAGNFLITYKKFSFTHSTNELIFKDLVITKPDEVDLEGRIQGGIYDGGEWKGKNIWPGGYSFEKSCINIGKGYVGGKSVNEDGFLTGKKIIWATLDAKVYIPCSFDFHENSISKTTEYVCPVISKTLYNADDEETSSKTVYLTGNHKIPTVKITSSAGWKDKSTYHFNGNWCDATIEIINGDETVDLPSTAVKIRDRGNSTRWEGKTPFALKFEEKHKILGMSKDKRWVLMANYFDRALIRNRFVGTLGNEIYNTCWNAQFTPVNVYVNEKFIGTYDLGEQVKIGSKRVDVQSLEDYVLGTDSTEDSNNDGVIDIKDAGFLLEIDFRNKQSYNFYSEKYYLPMNFKDPDFDSDTKTYDSAKLKEAQAYAKKIINDFESVLAGDDFAKKYADYIDVDSFIDWYIVNEFGKNFDSLFQTSVYLYYDPVAQKIKMGPNWDFDLGLGNCNGANDTNGNGIENPTGWYVHGGTKGIGSDNDELSAKYTELYGSPDYRAFWINRLFEAPAFQTAVKKRWNAKRVSLKNAINKYIVEYANDIYDYIPMNEENLPRLGQSSWNGPSGYEQRTEYEDEIYYMYNWCMKRFEWMDSEIKKW